MNNDRTLKAFCLVLATIAIIIDIAVYSSGKPPTWGDVFSSDIALATVWAWFWYETK
jgi:uncharacterized membrane protein